MILMQNNPLIGKIVHAVFISEDGGAIRFDLNGGDETIIARADGDCCSHSWIEEIQGVEQLLGSPVVSVEDVTLREPEDKTAGPEYGDYTQFYGCKITTQKGYAMIDYRNNSNGYYGGSLVWPGEYFYGGVHGQNGTTENWKPIS